MSAPKKGDGGNIFWKKGDGGNIFCTVRFGVYNWLLFNPSVPFLLQQPSPCRLIKMERCDMCDDCKVFHDRECYE